MLSPSARFIPRRILAEARGLYDEDEIDPAIKLFEHLLAGHTDAIEEWYLRALLGMCYYYADRDEEAVQMLEGALKGVGTGPENGLSRLNTLDYLGKAYFTVDRFEDSMDCLGRAKQSLELYTLPEWSAARHRHVSKRPMSTDRVV